MRHFALSCMILMGLIVVAVCGYYALQDWAALRANYARFDALAQRSADLRTLFVAEARQNIHRVNLFADGVWALLGAILAAIGVHGLCLLERGSDSDR